MKNLFSAMNDIGKIQKKMDEMRKQFDKLEASGKAGGGLVEVVMKGGSTVKKITIDPSLLDPKEAKVLQDLLAAAFNNARENLEQMRDEHTKEMLSGMPLPEGFKLPF